MPGYYDMRVLVRLLIVSCVMLFTPLAWSAEGGSAKEQAQRQQDQPLNNAPVWRDVRGGENPYQTTQVRGVETNILIQAEGQIWREIRNGPVTIFGGWLIIVVTALIAFYYYSKGALKLHGKPTGRKIDRFTTWDRILHWTIAISFVILAVSGVIMLFGRYVVLPAVGYTLFSWLAALSKNLHNFVGPVFAVCVILMFIAFVKDNLPRAYDWLWVRKFGGMFGSREHVPSGRFNAGEKVWFWLGVTVCGIVVSVTGFILDFPNFEQGRGTMQLVNVIHASVAVLFIAMGLGHIYMGTIGVEGAYDAMRYDGQVDEQWAKEHHEYWYDEVKHLGRSPGGAPSAARASAMKEGWKL